MPRTSRQKSASRAQLIRLGFAVKALKRGPKGEVVVVDQGKWDRAIKNKIGAKPSATKTKSKKRKSSTRKTRKKK